ncbi:UNVERIFIED_CONTAM: hypothetical protein HDU68_009197 [Siphonaria sp. JEL0065]|nr:hypothetical protein HDU68_009197 [Siphonaria sp. JEL0065]
MLTTIRSRLVSRVSLTRQLTGSVASRASGHGHDDHHDHHGGEPSGYFLADPANKKTKYFWEPVFVWGYLGGTAVFLTAYAFSPNKSPSQVAKIEAHKRLSESGEAFGWPLPPDCELSLSA